MMPTSGAGKRVGANVPRTRADVLPPHGSAASHRETPLQWEPYGHQVDFSQGILLPRGLPMDSILRDVRYGFRSLIKSPGLTLIATLALPLAIGLTTLMFSMV